MRRFSCPVCGNEIHFANTQCTKCGVVLHYDPALDCFPGAPNAGHETSACSNRAQIGCNWISDSDRDDGLCKSCARTLTIPDLSQPDNAEYWARLERAKRLLFRSLRRLSLPLGNGDGASRQLMFELKHDETLPDGSVKRVTTGHDDGLITINIEEADDVIRERNRSLLGEPYRTLVGHFRHEVGHYYWDVLVCDAGRLEEFRCMFGDERSDYAAALETHYDRRNTRPAPAGFVSDYAASHPWEDFAETWAHYLHIVDGLETAAAYALLPEAHTGTDTGSGPPTFDPYIASDFDGITSRWIPLTVAMNAMNRSIGNFDFYPFVMSDPIMSKLRFIHGLVHPDKAGSPFG